MLKRTFTFVLLLHFSWLSDAQSLQTASEFLGYELGSKFTFHHRVIDYFEYVAKNSDKVKVQQYGQSLEGRPLIVAFISSSDNIQKLEAYQKANLSATTGTLDKGLKQLPIVWLSYNIHGDEAAATEAALATLTTLISEDATVNKWLEELIIVIDPCENPDGRDRYTMWINQVINLPSNPDIDALEHNQPWPGGRFNHYLFDLNRDWAWQIQHESQLRVQLYQQWMPQVYVDFHEMGHESSYFFAPAAEPSHEIITDWQREFQVHVGESNARYFDKKGTFYFTKEVYDLLYPSYGDTWPLFNGAIGFTYEQGGSGKASLAVMQETGNILTLQQRLENHKTTGLSTIETAYTFRKKLLQEFNKYFQEAKENPKGDFKTYIIREDSEEKKKAFMDLLRKQQIEFGCAKEDSVTYTGFNYFTKQNSNFELSKGDIVISAHQPQSNLLKVLFEPETKLQDSLTYDLTAWALPYVYGLETYGLSENIEIDTVKMGGDLEAFSTNIYAYLLNWESPNDALFLAEALKQGLKVRFLNKPTIVQNKAFDRGALVIARADNQGNDFVERVEKVKATLLQSEIHIKLSEIETGMVHFGSDLGAGSVQYIKPPKVALLGGSGISPTAFGEVWHYFEQTIKYPVSVLYTEYFKQVDLNQYDVLILTSGSYSRLQITSKLLAFVRDGGKVICLGNANQIFANERDTQLGKAVAAERNREEYGFNPTGLERYENREREDISNSVAGSIYKVYLDNTHPLAYGYDTAMYLIKQNQYLYPLLQGNTWNVGMFKDDSHISGFIGANLKPKIPQTMAFGVEELGRGDIVYLCDSPIFRGFWYSGNLLLANAIFFVD